MTDISIVAAPAAQKETNMTATATVVAAPKRGRPKAEATPAPAAPKAAKPAKAPKVEAAPAAKGKAKATPAKPAPAPKAAKAPVADAIVQNGIRRPREGGSCAKAWALFDAAAKRLKGGENVTLAAVADDVAKQGLSEGNVRAELYTWRKFNGVASPRARAN